MRLIALLLLSILVSPATGAAQPSCGGAQTPCAVAGGVYHIIAPEGPGPHPAAVFLHGWGGSGAGQIKNRGLVGSLLARGYAVIAPTGQPRGQTGGQGRSGHRWNSYGDPRWSAGLRDDVGFLADVADDAAARFGLDRERMLLAGFSGGGMMSWRVACDQPDAFAAYAPVAGLLWRPLPARCAGPVRLLHTHGWADPVVPLEGRRVGGGALGQGDLFAGLALLRASNGCQRSDPDFYDFTGPFWRRGWTDCAPGSALEFALHDGGHRVPAGWSDLALDWFEATGGG